MNKILYLLNSIVVFILIFLISISYIPPSKLSLINYLTLLTPIFLILNFLFAIYWLLKLNKKCLLSLIFLIITFKEFQKLYAFGFLNKNHEKKSINSRVKLMTYNSHAFKKIKNNREFYIDEFKLKCNENLPNILFFQETMFNWVDEMKPLFKNNSSSKDFDLLIKANSILSNHLIANAHFIENKIKEISQHTIYSDIVIKNDTMRYYNIHLLSYRFSKEAGKLQEKGIINLKNRLSTVFKYQEQQVKQLIDNIKKSPYPAIVAGDFNNNAFSYIYRKLLKEGNLKDTFVESGSGFGSTFNFKYFPTRIDFILVPKSAKVHWHKVEKTKNWSDHYPLITEISF